MANLNGFDATTIPPQEEFKPVPKGEYIAIATSSEWKDTKNKDGQYLEFTFEVLDGQYKGRKIWTRLNLNNKSQGAVSAAQRELAAFCNSLNIPRPQDSSELHNKPVTIKVDLDQGPKGENNVIKGYSPVTQAAPTYAPPAAQAQAPAAQAAAATAAPPWARS